jgi:hypothetical protein
METTTDQLINSAVAAAAIHEDQATELDPTATELEPEHTGLRSIRDIVRDLKRPLPPEHLATKPAGSGSEKLTYIPWYVASAYLDKFAPGWSYEIRSNQVFDFEITKKGSKVRDTRQVITVRISVPAKEGVIFREATGQCEVALSGYGDPTSNAEGMALRRAAAKFGLGLWLYKKK